jgi:hypothetical protein
MSKGWQQQCPLACTKKPTRVPDGTATPFIRHPQSRRRVRDPLTTHDGNRNLKCRALKRVDRVLTNMRSRRVEGSAERYTVYRTRHVAQASPMRPILLLLCAISCKRRSRCLKTISIKFDSFRRKCTSVAKPQEQSQAASKNLREGILHDLRLASDDVN